MGRTTTRWRWAVVAAGAVLVAVLILIRGREPKSVPAKVEAPPKVEAPAEQDDGQPAWAKLTEDSIKPLPLESIPDDPPPHEGALFEISYRIEPPDLILVEALDTSPGRPISGERLVRPDGTITLQFYGDVHVAGLTIDQAKAKIVYHLRAYLTDMALGLVLWDESGNGLGGKGPRGKHVARPADALPTPPPSFDEFDAPILPAPRSLLEELDAKEAPNKENDRPIPARPGDRSARKSGAPPINPFAPLLPRSETGQDPLLPPPVLGKTRQVEPGPVAQWRVLEEDAPAGEPGYVHVAPADSDRVFVDVTAYNSKVYYIQGDVGQPGRMPITGKETVLDAIFYSGGLLPSADRHNIHLNRPARGDKPARSYKIDFDAIERGDKKANLQVFPDDRLLIERRKEIAREIPRA